jgi:hypothetical protein
MLVTKVMQWRIKYLTLLEQALLKAFAAIVSGLLQELAYSIRQNVYLKSRSILSTPKN